MGFVFNGLFACLPLVVWERVGEVWQLVRHPIVRGPVPWSLIMALWTLTPNSKPS